MTWVDFRKTYLWGNRGLEKDLSARAAYRYRRNILLVLNLDSRFQTLDFNQKFNLRLELKRMNSRPERKIWSSSDGISLDRLRKVISDSLQTLHKKRSI